MRLRFIIESRIYVCYSELSWKSCIHLILLLMFVFGFVSVGDLLAVLDVSTNEKMLPTTYGRLQPPLGIHRLKVRLILVINV